MGRKPKNRPRGMGSVIFRGGTWSIRWKENGRRRFKSGYPDQNTATLVLHKILSDIARGEVDILPEAKNVPALEELAQDWLQRRKNRSAGDDRSRWKCQLGPFFGRWRPAEVTAAEIRRFVEAKIAGGLSSTTAGHCVRLLSVFFNDLVERGMAATNPVATLPRTTRQLYRNAHDPATTPFLERQEDIRALFAFEQPFATFFAIGVFAGLRPGEIPPWSSATSTSNAGGSLSSARPATGGSVLPRAARPGSFLSGRS